MEGEDDKLISDGSNKKHEENKADVNTGNNDNANNSDDIIPSENTQPEENNSSITASQMEMSQVKQPRRTEILRWDSPVPYNQWILVKHKKPKRVRNLQ